MLEKTDRTVVPPHLRMCRFATQTHELPDGRVEGGSGTAKAAAGAEIGAMCKQLRNLDLGWKEARLAQPSMPKIQIWKRQSIKDASWHVETTTFELTVG